VPVISGCANGGVAMWMGTVQGVIAVTGTAVFGKARIPLARFVVDCCGSKQTESSGV